MGVTGTALPMSGQISIYDIYNQWADTTNSAIAPPGPQATPSLNLLSYRGCGYHFPSTYTFGTFGYGQLSLADFYGKAPFSYITPE